MKFSKKIVKDPRVKKYNEDYMNHPYENLKRKIPLVHTITNYVTVNDCANIILAVGGSPIMADSILEVEEITSICNALVINIGTLNERVIGSMIKAGKKANAIGNPTILDPVGVGASSLRMETTFKLLEEVDFSIISGNASEIKTIYKESGKTSGVDANEEDKVEEGNLDQMVEMCKNLSKRTGSLISLTGAIDIVANSKEANVIYNGNPLMAGVSGTGCMLSTVIAAYCGANKDDLFQATTLATAHMGLAGEIAFEKLRRVEAGSASYKIFLIDGISQIDFKTLKEGVKIESR